MRKKFDTLKKDQKGFTLVELIVVLVILAIMAALLAPALLGYIDEARSTKYLEECRSISTALQAIEDELYAKGSSPLTASVTAEAEGSKLNKLVYPTKVIAYELEYKTGSKKKDGYIIKRVKSLTFISQDTSKIVASQDDSGEWTVTGIYTSGNTSNWVN